MTTEEAVRACEFWTIDLAETKALGTTSNPTVGLHFNGDEYQPEVYTNPARRGWAIRVPRYVPNGEENEAYRMVAAEIERRRG
jgi:hypothetical protein